MSTPMLQIGNLSRSFGGVRAVNEVSFCVQPDEILGLIGPNGAGKTTVFNLITGLYRIETGTIRVGEAELTGRPPHAIGAAGVARTFQNVRIYDGLSVLENVMVGRHVRTRSGFVGALLKWPLERREERQIAADALRLLERVGLADRAREDAGSLPFGRMRLLEIARALASEPRVLLLDEPAAGLNHAETEALAELIGSIRDEGIAVVLVEHDMHLVMQICDRVVVLESGRKIADGSPREVQNDPQVIAAYLGSETGGGEAQP